MKNALVACSSRFTFALMLGLSSVTAALAADHDVSIEGFRFVPANLTVAVGDTVTFTNNDGAPHTATGDGFDTGTLRKGQSGTVTITAAGDNPYRCSFHPMMKGMITAN